MYAVETVVDPSLEVPAEHAGEGRRCVEDGGTLCQFTGFVPRSEDEMSCRIEDTLDQADEESNRYDMIGGCHRCEAESQSLEGTGM